MAKRYRTTDINEEMPAPKKQYKAITGFVLNGVIVLPPSTVTMTQEEADFWLNKKAIEVI